MFNIFWVEQSTLWIGEDGEPMVFETGQLAAAYCKENSEDGVKLQPRKAGGGDVKWRDRETERIANGIYKRPEYLDKLEQNPDHFLHLAEKRPGQLAYTKDAGKGMQDLQAIISLQGYIETFVSACDEQLTEDVLDEIMAEHEGRSLDDDGLKFAETPDAIAEVYTNYDGCAGQVAASCMRYETNIFSEDGSADLPMHPCAVYGAGDLAVAYTTNTDGQTMERALCWPEKKVYSRVYSDDGRLHRLLKKRGFTKSNAYFAGEPGAGEHSLEGARLLKVSWDGDSDVFVAPYCDDIPCAKVSGKFLVLHGDGRIDLRRTDGWSAPTTDEDEDGYYCENCEERCSETLTVYTGRRHHQEWCYYCQQNHAFYCDSAGEYYSDSNVNQHEVGDETWSQYAVENDATLCERLNRYYPTDDMQYVVINEHGDTEQWGPRAVDRYSWTCAQTKLLVSDAVDPVEVFINGVLRDVAPHIANDRAGTELVPYKVNPKRLTLKGDDPGQLQLPLYGDNFIMPSSYYHETSPIIMTSYSSLESAQDALHGWSLQRMRERAA